MQLETFDLSVDRSAKPEVSGAARATGRYVQVLRCDAPASLSLDGSAAEAVPAFQGLVLEGFNNVYVSNEASGGRLVLGYYDCAVGAPAPFFPTVDFKYDAAAAGVIPIVRLTPPDPNWSAFVSGIIWSAGSLGGTQDAIQIQERTPGATTGANVFRRQVNSALAVDLEFPEPIIFPNGLEATIFAPEAGVGETADLIVLGGLIR